jgi:hypothetical protein
MTENKWQGCYGARLSYSELDQFIEDTISLDSYNEISNVERYGTCIWGFSGVGKTSKLKQLRNTPVSWNGKNYNGYDVRSVPIAQFEEMGDLHGMPDKHVQVCKDSEFRWVPSIFSEHYLKHGWELNYSSGIRTMYAAPDWVPTEPGPCILILDDFNRAGSRIIKGLMQFLQEYGLMSWKLPPGCHIVMTANPDEQEYFVTSIDSSVHQRIRSCTLEFDAKEWSVWAENSDIDARIISYVLAYPEMVVECTERTSPRSLSEVGRYLKMVGEVSHNRIKMMASSVLDKSTVDSFITFLTRDFEMVISPEDILAGNPCVFDKMKDLMTRKEKRIDVMGVTCDRLFAYLSKPEIEPEKEFVKNVQLFLTNDWLEPEMRYVFVDRLNRASDKQSKMDKWFLGNRDLMKNIMELV